MKVYQLLMNPPFELMCSVTLVVFGTQERWRWMVAEKEAQLLFRSYGAAGLVSNTITSPLKLSCAVCLHVQNGDSRSANLLIFISLIRYLHF